MVVDRRLERKAGVVRDERADGVVQLRAEFDEQRAAGNQAVGGLGDEALDDFGPL